MDFLASLEVIFFALTADSRTRGYSMKLCKERSRLNVCKYYFSNRIVSCWNSLPDHVIAAEFINSFKV